jgi:DNA-directed RNA polymerase specialized sigma24 family protein
LTKEDPMISVAAAPTTAIAAERQSLSGARWRLLLGDALRRRFDHEEQAIFGMLLAAIEPEEIAATLKISAGELESRLWAMLRRLEAPGAAGSNSHPTRALAGCPMPPARRLRTEGYEG